LSDQTPPGLKPTDPSPPRTLVTVATYKEAENLERLIERILAVAPQVDILVIDDNSPDGTGAIADRLAAADRRVSVLHRPGKLGLGSALLDAIKLALERKYDLLLNLDADFSHPPESIPSLLDGMNRHDVTIGSRYVPGGAIEGWDFKRHLMSKAINVYSRILLGLAARDTSGSFRCYRLAKVALIDFDRIHSKGYSFMEEFLYHCKTVRCSIGEVPIVFVNRKHGKSKISPWEAIKALQCLLWVSVRDTVRPPRRPPKS
jgi:dolichol-phosphate mannosyltransferase